MNKMVQAITIMLTLASAAFAADGNAGWISEEASFTITGDSARKPLPSFLTGKGMFYNKGKEDAYSVSIKPSENVAIIIDLGKIQPVRNVVIKNRAASGNQNGLTVSTSKDNEKWHRAAITRGAFVPAWNVRVAEGTTARYIKIARYKTSIDKPLELKWAKVYSEPVHYTGFELGRLYWEGTEQEKYSDVKVPDWFTNGPGLGLFLHWGPWSTTFWSTCGWSYWRNREKVPMEEYKKLVGHFNPGKYDPDIWMKAAKRAGIGYAVITSRHHDGYELWPTKIENDWGTKGYMNGRDLLKPYVEACRNNDIKVGFYFSGTDWFWNPEGWPSHKFPYEKIKAPDGSPHPAFNDIQKYMDIMFDKNIYPAVEELMTRYGKIDVLWFDGLFWPACNTHPFEAEKMIRSHSPDILINPRYAGGILGQYETAENRFPRKRPHRKDWELCASVRGGWGACRPGNRQGGMPTAWVLSLLAKCRSWGGNLLANIGPMPDGTMPVYFYNLCDELEGWLKHSREAVENVKGGPWPEQSNVPVTTKGNTWYLFGWPQDGKGGFDVTLAEKQRAPMQYEYKAINKTLIVRDVTRPSKAALLHNGKELKCDYKNKTLTIVIPADMTTKLVDVVKVQF